MHIFKLKDKNDKKNAPNAVLITLKTMGISEAKNDIDVMTVSMFFKTKGETLKPRKNFGMTGQIASKHI